VKIGDLVRWCGKICVVTEVYESKIWRTDKMGKMVRWGEIEPEPFARILLGDELRGVPQTDLEVVSGCS